MTYLLFFFSGLSGLIYQVVWVRTFGNVFGNTIYSASFIVAVFMLGLGAGSFLVGGWADRRYALMIDGTAQTNALLRVYGQFELVIAAMGLGITLLLPHLGVLSAMVPSYSRELSGWYALSTSSYLARAGIAIGLLAPITFLMGGTLTLLIRHLVRRDLELGGWRIALLYGINTAGAAVGAALTDSTLVPAWGLSGTQLTAVALNVAAGVGALLLAARETSRMKPAATTIKRIPREIRGAALQAAHEKRTDRVVALTSLTMAMTGLAALGMEILWFRHFSILLGGFRAVFSLLSTLILAGIA